MASAPQLPELDFEAMSAEDILRWAYSEFGDRLCLTCSWQKQSSVLVHMVAELGLDIAVSELDTPLFFRESYETRDRLIERYGLRLLPPPPLITVAEQHRQEGPNPWEGDPDRYSPSPSTPARKPRPSGSPPRTAAATSARSSRC